MRLTESDNISENIMPLWNGKDEPQIVYGNWFFHDKSDFLGTNLPYFLCTIGNLNTYEHVTFKCPFSRNKIYVEKSMMKVISAYNELARFNKNSLFSMTTRHMVLEKPRMQNLKDNLSDYIKANEYSSFDHDYINNIHKVFKDEEYMHVGMIMLFDEKNNLIDNNIEIELYEDN